MGKGTAVEVGVGVAAASELVRRNIPVTTIHNGESEYSSTIRAEGIPAVGLMGYGDVFIYDPISLSASHGLNIGLMFGGSGDHLIFKGKLGYKLSGHVSPYIELFAGMGVSVKHSWSDLFADTGLGIAFDVGIKHCINETHGVAFALGTNTLWRVERGKSNLTPHHNWLVSFKWTFKVVGKDTAVAEYEKSIREREKGISDEADLRKTEVAEYTEIINKMLAPEWVNQKAGIISEKGSSVEFPALSVIEGVFAWLDSSNDGDSKVPPPIDGLPVMSDYMHALIRKAPPEFSDTYKNAFGSISKVYIAMLECLKNGIAGVEEKGKELQAKIERVKDPVLDSGVSYKEAQNDLAKFKRELNKFWDIAVFPQQIRMKFSNTMYLGSESVGKTFFEVYSKYHGEKSSVEEWVKLEPNQDVLECFILGTTDSTTHKCASPELSFSALEKLLKEKAGQFETDQIDTESKTEG